MVSTSEGLIYYCTVFLTALVFLTEASAIATNYEKSSTQQNKTHQPHDISSPRTKLTPTRSRSSLSSKNQNHDRVSPFVLTKLKSNAKIESATDKSEVSEMLLVSNSGGENDVKDKGGGSNTDDDDQKTLSQQVADGKYGLIQNEIFTIKPSRPGVISYDVNPEVPKDNINNLGGLEQEDIWLAENHLLVLAGGSLGGMQGQWTPIDNYAAPKRPVKIPPNPKVPPPFPIQLTKDGPIEYIGSQPVAQPFSFFNPLLMPYPSFNRSPNYDKVPYGSTGDTSPLKPSFPIHINQPPPSPILVKPPPGAEFIPPYLGSTNQSEAVDEDDPSLYYPPPYDFYYLQDNTTKVPPGPLVPGIVLPPPPDFFTTLGDKNKSKIGPKAVHNQGKQQLKPSIYKFGKQLHHPDDNTNLLSSLTTPTVTTVQSPFIINNLNDASLSLTNKENLTYPDIKAHNANAENINQGWIPIPAPQPYYITGPLKPVENTILVMMDRPKQHGYTYNKPQNILKVLPKKKPSSKLLHHIDQPNTHMVFDSTTPLTPQIGRTQLPVQSDTYITTPISPAYNPSAAIKATYYFYKEPKFEDIDTKSVFSTTSPPLLDPQTVFGYDQQIRSQSSLSNKPISEKKRKPISPTIPIYYLAELENIVDLIKPADLPYTRDPKIEYYTTSTTTTTTKPTYASSKPSYERSTLKPILEYSYLASDYSIPVNPVTESTPQTPALSQQYNPSPHYTIDYNTYYHPAPQHYSIFRPIVNKYPKNPVQTTATPILYLGNLNHYVPENTSPKYHLDQSLIRLNPYSSISYSTESPYYPFFTKEDEDLIDDNTKKYFTLFGQKIKHNVETTSPLYTNYPSQSSTSSYSSLSSTVSPYYQKPTPLYQISSTNKPISLEGDTKVNYRTPLPSVNSDAEYIPSSLAKHIRPIVVGDLPLDIHERLKNLMNQDNIRQYSNNQATNKVRYALGGSKLGDSLPYPQNHINTYRNNHRESFSRLPSSTPISLEGDIQVNYNQHTQKQTKNPDAEYVSLSSESDYDISTETKDKYDERNRAQESRTSKPISLGNDILVNYKGQYTPDPDAEYINTSNEGHASPDSSSSSNNQNTNPRHHNVMSYKYPRDQNGYYFVTPQETHLSQIEDERYDYHSDVEKPSSYFKRVSHKRDSRPTQITTKEPKVVAVKG